MLLWLNPHVNKPDVIKELEKKGYSYPGDITYLEVKEGKHDLPTWGNAFPNFLKWAFKK